MSKKRPGDYNGIVFSTDPDFRLNEETSSAMEALTPQKQQLRIRLDKKQRAGKAVSLVEGFQGTSNDLETLGKQLKAFCGTGGSVKDGTILVQGDQRDKILQWLHKNGYTSAKKAV